MNGGYWLLMTGLWVGVGVWLGDGMGGTVAGYYSPVYFWEECVSEEVGTASLPLRCKLVGTFLYGA